MVGMLPRRFLAKDLGLGQFISEVGVIAALVAETRRAAHISAGKALAGTTEALLLIAVTGGDCLPVTFYVGMFLFIIAFHSVEEVSSSRT